MSAERKIYLKYIGAFSFTFMFVYMWIILSGKTLITSWDGLTQHYTALRYIGDYIKNAIYSTLNGGGIQEFDFNLGLGSDIIHTFSYYGLGDIELLVLAAICPQKYMEGLYCFLVYSKMLLAGICFLRLTRELECDVKASRIASLAYIYCNFALETSWGHYFFLNALIMMPWMICEVEKKIKGKKEHFALAVLISLCANYYLFYMCALATAAYGIIRTLWIKNIRKERILIWGSCIKDVFIAVLISAPFIFPAIYGYLNGSRTGTKITLESILLVNPLEIRQRLAEIGNGVVSGNTVGVSCIILLGIIALFCNKGRKEIKICVIGGVILLISPFTGFVFNAFSYVSYRYLFCYAFFLCLLFAYINPIKMCGDTRFLRVSLVLYIVLLFYSVCKIIEVRDIIVLCPLFCGIIAVLCIYKNVRYKYKYVMLLCGTSIVLHAWNVAGPEGDIPDRMVPIAEADIYATETMLLNFDTLQSDEGLYRVSASNSFVWFENYGIASKQSTIEMYYSIMNKYYFNAMHDMENPELKLPHRIIGFDKRTEIAELLSNKYYIASVGEEIPFGYEIIEHKEGKLLCINKYWIPIVYYYDSYVTEDMIENQNGVQKSELYLQTAVLDGTVEDILLEHPQSGCSKIQNVSAFVGENSVEGNVIINNNERLRIEFSGVCNAQYMVRLKGYKVCGEEHNVTVISEVAEKRYVIKGTDSRYYYESDAKTFNLGYSNEELSWCEFVFESQEEIFIEAIEVWILPAEEYISAVERLRTNAVQNITIASDCLEGAIVCDKRGVVGVSIPFSEGWSAFVDGKEVDVFRMNGSFLGIVIEEGNHSIRFEYKSPWLREGIYLSVLTLLVLIGCTVLRKKW